MLIVAGAMALFYLGNMALTAFFFRYLFISSTVGLCCSWLSLAVASGAILAAVCGLIAVASLVVGHALGRMCRLW